MILARVDQGKNSSIVTVLLCKKVIVPDRSELW